MSHPEKWRREGKGRKREGRRAFIGWELLHFLITTRKTAEPENFKFQSKSLLGVGGLQRLGNKGGKNNWSGVNQDINITKGRRANRLYPGCYGVTSPENWARIYGLGHPASALPLRKPHPLRTRL